MTGQDARSICPYGELAVGWALHCLEPEDEALLAEHLPSCAQCSRTVAQTEEVGAALASVVPQLDPQPDLEWRIRTAAAQAPSTETQARSGKASTTELPTARRRFRSRGTAMIAAAAVLVAVTIGLGVRVAQLDSERDDLQAQRNATAGALSQILGKVADPEVGRTALATPDGSPMAVVFTTETSVTVVPVHLPPNDATRETYVLWGLRGDSAEALVVFDVSTELGTVPAARADQAEQTGPFTAFAVSVEPGRTAPISYSQVIASGTVPS